MLFLSNEHGPHLGYSAYVHRLVKLRSALEQRGIHTEMLSLRDERFCQPVLTQALDMPSLAMKVAGFGVIQVGCEAAHSGTLLKLWTKTRMIHDLHGDSLRDARLNWSVRSHTGSAYLIGQAFITKRMAFRYANYVLVVSKPLHKLLMQDMHKPIAVIRIIRNARTFARATYDCQMICNKHRSALDTRQGERQRHILPRRPDQPAVLRRGGV